MNSTNDKWNGCKFFYFRDVFMPQSNAHVTVAFRVLSTDDESIVYECQSAFSSPKERFSKKLGRNIASGRLNKAPLRRLIANNRDVGLFRNVIQDVQENALKELVDFHNPAWWTDLKKKKSDALKYLRYVASTFDQNSWNDQVQEKFSDLQKPWEK